MKASELVEDSNQSKIILKLMGEIIKGYLQGKSGYIQVLYDTE